MNQQAWKGITRAARVVLPVILLVLLGISRFRYERDLGAARKYVDSLMATANERLAARDSALAAGDVVPEWPLSDSRGNRTTLAALAKSGFRLIYLYRTDCPACSFLKPFLDSAPTRLLARVAFVTYSRRGSLSAEFGTNRYGAAMDSSHAWNPLAIVVPSLLEIRPDGRVAAAVAGLQRTGRLFGMHGILDARRLEAAVARARASSSRVPQSSSER